MTLKLGFIIMLLRQELSGPSPPHQWSQKEAVDKSSYHLWKYGWGEKGIRCSTRWYERIFNQ